MSTQKNARLQATAALEVSRVLYGHRADGMHAAEQDVLQPLVKQLIHTNHDEATNSSAAFFAIAQQGAIKSRTIMAAGALAPLGTCLTSKRNETKGNAITVLSAICAHHPHVLREPELKGFGAILQGLASLDNPAVRIATKHALAYATLSAEDGMPSSELY